MKDKEGRPELRMMLNYLTHRIDSRLTARPRSSCGTKPNYLCAISFWQQKIESYRETFRRRNCVTIFITPEPSALYRRWRPSRIRPSRASIWRMIKAVDARLHR